MSDFLLTQIINYGAPILGAIVLLGAMGVPVPGTLSVIAAGAFVQQGILSLPGTALIGLICAVIGDSLSYGMGFYARDAINRRFRRTSGWLQAEAAFQRWGALSIFFSRFFVTAIAIPVNLLAGTSNFSYRRFIVYDIAGEVLWIAGFGGLGYMFGSEWELVSEFAADFGGLMLGLVLLGIGIRLGLRWFVRHNHAKEKVSEG